MKTVDQIKPVHHALRGSSTKALVWFATEPSIVISGAQIAVAATQPLGTQDI